MGLHPRRLHRDDIEQEQLTNLLLVQRVDLLDSLVHNKITVERDGVKSYTAVTSTLRRKVIKPARHGDPRLVLLFATGNGQARNVNTNPGQRIRRRRP
jgi:hypothetical protein